MYLADGEILDVMGMGDVCIILANSNVWTLHKVKHVPNLKKYLVSIGRLYDGGHLIVFPCGIWKVTKGGMVLAHCQKKGILYMKSLSFLSLKQRIMQSSGTKGLVIQVRKG